MAIEIAENVMAIGGKFTPKANQKENCSLFAVCEGNPQDGWLTLDELLNEGLWFPNLKIRMTGFAEFKDGKRGPNRFKHKGMMITEVIGSRKDFNEKQRLEELASRNQVSATKADAERNGSIGEGRVSETQIEERVQSTDLPLPGE